MARQPIKDLDFIEFGITYLMLAPSRLQLNLLGKKLDVKPEDIDVARMKSALKAVGFQDDDDVNQILATLQRYLTFLVASKNRDVLKQVNQMLIDSKFYAGEPPHPGDGGDQVLAPGLLGLAGRVPTKQDHRNARARTKGRKKHR